MGTGPGGPTLEDGIHWAASNGFHYLDFGCDHGANELLPGQGTMDFGRLFGRLEGDGYRGPYMLTFGNREQKIAGRDYLLHEAGLG
jgi:hypothetical protein